jgi:hypothetical protein
MKTAAAARSHKGTTTKLLRRVASNIARQPTIIIMTNESFYGNRTVEPRRMDGWMDG